MKFKIAEWKPMRKGSLYGFATVIFDGELKVTGICIRESKSGGMWAGMPANKWTDRKSVAHWEPFIEFIDKERGDAFSAALIARLTDAYPADFGRSMLRAV